MNLSTRSLILFSVCSLLTACADDPGATAGSDSVSAPDPVPVTLENYKTAESDLAFNNVTKFVGTNQFLHFPVDAFDLDNQTVVRMNRDTIYSGAVVNVSGGATVTLPESDGRYLSAMVVQNDHYIDQVFKTLTSERPLSGAISIGQRNTLSENHCLAKMLLNQRNS